MRPSRSSSGILIFLTGFLSAAAFPRHYEVAFAIDVMGHSGVVVAPNQQAGLLSPGTRAHGMAIGNRECLIQGLIGGMMGFDRRLR
jgi:hypothetical protein